MEFIELLPKQMALKFSLYLRVWLCSFLIAVGPNNSSFSSPKDKSIDFLYSSIKMTEMGNTERGLPLSLLLPQHSILC